MDVLKCHNLDLGAPRFIELQLSLVLPGVLDLDLLESTALTLVARWPSLNTRMNLVVSNESTWS